MSKPNILRLVFFVLAFAAALYYPVRKVLAYERPAVPPTGIRFRVEGYDPYDFARGRYLRLNTRVTLKISAREWLEKRLGENRTKVFAVLEPDQDGAARVTDILPPDNVPAGKVFVTAEVVCHDRDSVSLHLPFDRYYLNEKLATPAEKLLREAREAGKPVALVVDIYADGNYAVRDLLVDGKPLREHLVPKQK